VNEVRKVAQLSEKDRRDLFRATAQAMEIHEAIIEKDFWVCWVLDFLFTDSQWKERLAFKGGTSLSKAYAILQRFSEDIDLVLDWALLCYAKEPWQSRSTTQQSRFTQEANCRAVQFLAEQMAPDLGKHLGERAGIAVQVQSAGQDILSHLLHDGPVSRICQTKHDLRRRDRLDHQRRSLTVSKVFSST